MPSLSLDVVVTTRHEHHTVVCLLFDKPTWQLTSENSQIILKDPFYWISAGAGSSSVYGVMIDGVDSEIGELGMNKGDELPPYDHDNGFENGIFKDKFLKFHLVLVLNAWDVPLHTFRQILPLKQKYGLHAQIYSKKGDWEWKGKKIEELWCVGGGAEKVVV
ncbi:hypothetical protein Fot_32014 [Forsythia ovata]|uniref:Uncharacterized protein n=1 Tax=Forsythia ovata TaxID=205694 RepID=A0ABD1T6N4_9LAMI